MRARRIAAGAVALGLAFIAAPPAGATGSEPLTIRGRFVDADGSPIAGARLTISSSYGLILGSGGFAFAGDGGGYPGCIQNCVHVSEKTDDDGRFEFAAPAEIVQKREELERGDTTGFSLTAYAPVPAGERIGAVVEVSHRLERGDVELTLPTMHVWRPEMRTEQIAPGQVRLRWSRVPRRYGRAVSEPSPGVYPSVLGHPQRTGPASARINLLGLAPESVWMLSATTQVGDESNVTFGSPPVRLPAPPTPVSRGRSCLVIGTAGTRLQGQCALTDGDPKSTVGRVFRDTCTPDDLFCDPELPNVVAVDLGAETELALIRGSAECMFTCRIVLSSDGSTWKDLPDPVASPTSSRCADRNPAQALPFGISDVSPPAGTRARYVGLSGSEADRLARPRGGVGRLPARSEPFDPDATRRFEAISAGEITVFAVGSAARPEICRDMDDDLPFLGLPPSELRRERNMVVTKVIAGVVAFLAGLGVVRERQRATRRFG